MHFEMCYNGELRKKRDSCAIHTQRVAGNSINLFWGNAALFLELINFSTFS